jgi:hypothetical protein
MLIDDGERLLEFVRVPTVYLSVTIHRLLE